jgi:AcrR family transcriptional regulator
MTERGRATRARLIEATLAVVREVGYPHASTRAIAEAAGVAEGTIYRHFPDKASLFFAAALASGGPALDRVASLPERAGQATVEANLADAVAQLAALQERIMPLELAILADPELAAQRRQAMATGRVPQGGPPEAIRAYLAAERQLGRVRADVDPNEATIVLLAALFGLALAPGSTVRGPAIPVDPERLAGAVRILARGIAPTGTP